MKIRARFWMMVIGVLVVEILAIFLLDKFSNKEKPEENSEKSNSEDRIYIRGEANNSVSDFLNISKTQAIYSEKHTDSINRGNLRVSKTANSQLKVFRNKLDLSICHFFFNAVEMKSIKEEIHKENMESASLIHVNIHSSFDIIEGSKLSGKLLDWQIINKSQTILAQLPIDFDLISLFLFQVDQEETSVQLNLYLNNSNCTLDEKIANREIQFLLWNELLNINDTNHYLCKRQGESDCWREILCYFTTIWLGYDLCCSSAPFSDDVSCEPMSKNIFYLSSVLCYLLSLQIVWIFTALDVKYVKIRENDEVKFIPISSNTYKKLRNEENNEKLFNYQTSDRPCGLNRCVLKSFYKQYSGCCKCCNSFSPELRLSSILGIFFLCIGVYRTVGRFVGFRTIIEQNPSSVRTSEPIITAFFGQYGFASFFIDLIYCSISSASFIYFMPKFYKSYVEDNFHICNLTKESEKKMCPRKSGIEYSGLSNRFMTRLGKMSEMCNQCCTKPSCRTINCCCCCEFCIHSCLSFFPVFSFASHYFISNCTFTENTNSKKQENKNKENQHIDNREHYTNEKSTGGIEDDETLLKEPFDERTNEDENTNKISHGDLKPNREKCTEQHGVAMTQKKQSPEESHFTEKTNGKNQESKNNESHDFDSREYTNEEFTGEIEDDEALLIEPFDETCERTNADENTNKISQGDLKQNKEKCTEQDGVEMTQIKQPPEESHFAEKTNGKNQESKNNENHDFDNREHYTTEKSSGGIEDDETLLKESLNEMVNSDRNGNKMAHGDLKLNGEKRTEQDGVETTQIKRSPEQRQNGANGTQETTEEDKHNKKIESTNTNGNGIQSSHEDNSTVGDKAKEREGCYTLLVIVSVIVQILAYFGIYFLVYRPILSSVTFIFRLLTYFMFVTLPIRINLFRYTLIIATTIIYILKYLVNIVNLKSEILEYLFELQSKQTLSDTQELKEHVSPKSEDDNKVPDTTALNSEKSPTSSNTQNVQEPISSETIHDDATGFGSEMHHTALNTQELQRQKTDGNIVEDECNSDSYAQSIIKQERENTSTLFDTQEMKDHGTAKKEDDEAGGDIFDLVSEKKPTPSNNQKVQETVSSQRINVDTIDVITEWGSEKKYTALNTQELQGPVSLKQTHDENMTDLDQEKKLTSSTTQDKQDASSPQQIDDDMIEEDLYNAVSRELIITRKGMHFFIMKSFVAVICCIFLFEIFIDTGISVSAIHTKEIIELALVLIGPYAISAFLKGNRDNYLTEIQKQEIQITYEKYIRKKRDLTFINTNEAKENTYQKEKENQPSTKLLKSKKSGKRPIFPNISFIKQKRKDGELRNLVEHDQLGTGCSSYGTIPKIV